MCVAFVLYGWAAGATDRARNAATEHEVVVRGVDDRIDLLFDEVAAHDHDSRRKHSHTSAVRSSSSSFVALAMPRTPIASMVSDAHATPQTSASCRPFISAPVVTHRASIPPATASPAPVVSKAGWFGSEGTWTLPNDVYAVTPFSPALISSPSSHH